MKNRTQNPDSNTRPTQAIDTPTYVDATGPDIRVTRPAFMTDEQWSSLTDNVNHKFDELVEAVERAAVRRAVDASPERGCSEVAWCTMGPGEEHLSYHAGPTVELTGSTWPDARPNEDLAESGWWAWATWDRDKRPTVTIEGHALGERSRSHELEATVLADILAAVDTDPAMRALSGVLADVLEAYATTLEGRSVAP